MGYDLQAIVGRRLLTGESQFSSVKVVPLKQGLDMIPVTDDLFDEIQGAYPNGGEPFPRFEKLTASIAKWVQDLSANGLVAYVEAEFFGGVGGQSAVVWRQGDVVLDAVHSEDAINRALELLGVDVAGELDQFAAVGLGLHRSTKDW
jgi:hypothetical protein